MPVYRNENVKVLTLHREVRAGKPLPHLGGDILGEIAQVDGPAVERDLSRLEVIQLGEIVHEPLDPCDLPAHDRAQLLFLLRGEPFLERLRRGRDGQCR